MHNQYRYEARREERSFSHVEIFAESFICHCRLSYGRLLCLFISLTLSLSHSFFALGLCEDPYQHFLYILIIRDN